MKWTVAKNEFIVGIVSRRWEKYNYVILNWVLKKHITHGKNMVLIMSQLIC